MKRRLTTWMDNVLDLLPVLWPCLGVLLYVVANLSIGARAVQYDLQFWLPFIVHHSVAIPFMACMVAALFVGGPALVIAIFTWVLHFAL